MSQLLEPGTRKQISENMSRTSAFSLKYVLRRVLPHVVLLAALPFIIYQMMRHFVPVSDLIALTTAALPALMLTLFRFFYKKQIDVLGVVTLGSFVLCILIVLVTGDARFLLLREAMLDAVCGILCLLSLFFPQPIIFMGYKYLYAGMSPSHEQLLDKLWQQTQVRVTFRRVTWVVGIVLIAVVLMHITLLFTLSIAQFLGITPIITFPVHVWLVVWVVRSTRYALHDIQV